MRKLYLFVYTVLLITGCSPDKPSAEKTISVSIEPLRYITEQITGNDFKINVLVPSGASPETYEPTPAQMRTVANSLAYVNTGLLDFEHNLTRSIQENMPDVRSIRLSENIDLISETEEAEDSGDAGHHGHHHGTDPHIWGSPRCIKQMAETLYRNIAEMYPDSAKYKINYEQFTDRLDTLDAQLQHLFGGREISFMIYHPALTYLARDYGLHQIPLEFEGKEPSVEYVQKLVDTARKLDIKQLFYQNQFSKNTVDALSRELNVEAIAIDPLATNVEENILHMAKLIAKQ